MAEVKFTSANAVWVAGPDRIFFPGIPVIQEVSGSLNLPLNLRLAFA
jgi:hypothetical protein